MKREEQIAKDYLEHKKLPNIVYEPDGNIPPDFSIDGKIGVEVRRLNQYIPVNGIMQPVEEADYAVWGGLEAIAREIHVESYTHSVNLIARFDRPIKFKKLKPDIIKALKAHINTAGEDRTYKFGPNLEIRAVPSSRKSDTFFRHVGSNDMQSGGMIVEEIYNALPYILREKERKVQPHKDKYLQWWLVLIDTIGYGLDEHDLEQFRALPRLETSFDKVILVSLLDHSFSVELK